MMKGLMDCCMSQEMVVGRLREKAKVTKSSLRELEAWKEVQVNKLDLTNKLLKESEEQTKVLKNVFKDKKEVLPLLRKQVHRAKGDTVKEFRDSDTFFF